MKDAILAALESIKASLPDCIHKMRFGGRTAEVIVPASRTFSSEDFSSPSPQEMRRVVLPSSTFPEIVEGDIIQLDGGEYFVTSATIDPVGASLVLGISAEFNEMFSRSVSFLAQRKNGRVYRTTIRCGVVEDGYSEASSSMSNYSLTRTLEIIFPFGYWGWRDGKPQQGDEVEIRELNFKGLVSEVKKWDKVCYQLTCEAAYADI